MCPCLDYPELQKQLHLSYFDKLVELTDGRYDQRSDFTVVLQPHLRDLVPWTFVSRHNSYSGVVYFAVHGESYTAAFASVPLACRAALSE